MTPHEERLVLEFQSKWGNRWSRIARKLPGRTDNEIKNYWRTHMRKKAQEIRKTAMSPPSSISNSSSTSVSNSLQVDSIFPITETGNSLDPSSSVSKKSSSSPASKNPPPVDSITDMETDERSFYDTGGVETVAPTGEKEQDRQRSEKGYSMDDIWREIALSEEGCNLSCQTMDSPIWSYFPELPLTVEEEESKMLVPAITDQFFAGYDQIKSSN